MTVKVIGLDIAKNVFQVHGVNEAGAVVVRRKLRRLDVLRWFAGIDPAIIGIEACQTAHYWARELVALGHDVRLMPPQFVKPYVKSQKNDAADAEAICEAVQRPTMRFVRIKSAEQQAALLLHRTRDLLIRQRSSLINSIRAHFAVGIVTRRGVRDVDQLLALLTDTRTRLPELAREMLEILAVQLRDVAARVWIVEAKLLAWHRSNDVSRRLATIPGIGPITASAIAATVIDASQFSSGRQFAWPGAAAEIQRRQRTTGRYIKAWGRLPSSAPHSWRPGDRRLAQAVRENKHRWISGLLNRRPMNVATVVLANKSARVAWALMRHERDYDHRFARAA